MPRQELIRLSDRGRAEELLFVLQGGGIRCTILPIVDYEEGGFEEGRGIYWSLQVPLDFLEQARQILAEEGVIDEGAEHASSSTLTRRPPLYWVVGLVVLNLLVWIAKTGQVGNRRMTMLRFGASYAPLISAGQWWRTITAIFLHFGIEHLLANMFTLSILGPAVMGTWGVGRFFFLYLLAGVAGNWFSFILSPTQALKAGASGSILGLLGVLAGTRIRLLRSERREKKRSRFKTWHIIAMVIAFYGFAIGVSKNVDHLAHLGGLISGGLLALALPLPGQPSPKISHRIGALLGWGSVLLAAVAGVLAFRTS